MLVETMVLAAMNGLLLDERANFTLQFCRHAVAKFLERLDEKGLAFRERNRQGVEKGGCKRVAADPPTPFNQCAGKMPVAGLNMEIGWCRAIVFMIGFARHFGDR